MIFNSYDPENFFKAKFNDIDLLISTSSQVITSTPITDSLVPTFLMTRIGRAGKTMSILRNQDKKSVIGRGDSMILTFLKFF